MTDPVHSLTVDRGLRLLHRLSKLVTLTHLQYCRNVTDVVSLASVHSLKLRRCDNTSDVTAMAGVPNLRHLTAVTSRIISALADSGQRLTVWICGDDYDSDMEHENDE